MLALPGHTLPVESWRLGDAVVCSVLVGKSPLTVRGVFLRNVGGLVTAALPAEVFGEEASNQISLVNKDGGGVAAVIVTLPASAVSKSSSLGVRVQETKAPFGPFGSEVLEGLGLDEAFSCESGVEATLRIENEKLRAQLVEGKSGRKTSKSDKGSSRRVGASGSRDNPLGGLLAGLKEHWPTAEDFEDSDVASSEETEEEEGVPAYSAPGGVKPGVSPFTRASPGDAPREQKPSTRPSQSSPPPAPPPGGSMDMNQLLTALLVRELGHGRKKKREDSSSDSDRQGASGLRALNDKHKIDRRIVKRPRKLFLSFESDIREELGIVPGQAWTVVDWWRRVPWRRQKGISRCALILTRIYEYLRRGEYDSATAQTAQALKAMKQVALDDGSWDTAWLLTGLRDLLRGETFAGDFAEMSAISAYRRSLKELEQKPRREAASPTLSGGEEGGQVESNRARKARLKKEKRDGAAAPKTE